MGDRQCLRMPIAQPPRISKLPIVPLVAEPHAARIVIEGAWGAAFHWIAFGCETKHHVHQESHARLGTFLRARGESVTADRWGAWVNFVRAVGMAAEPLLPSCRRRMGLWRKFAYGPQLK